MATFHLHVGKVGRSEGRSAIAASAYRSCSKLYDPEQNKNYNFLPKRNQLIKSGITFPEQAKLDRPEQEIRQELWTKAHEADRRKNSVLARELTIALPKELEREQLIDLTQTFAQFIADSYKVAVDFAIHSPKDSQNVHAHLLFTTREIEICDHELTLGQKTRKLDDKKTGAQEIEKIRQTWEELCNSFLLPLNLSISRKSQKDKGKKANPYLKRESYYLAKRGILTPTAERQLNQTATVSPQESARATLLLEEPEKLSQKQKQKEENYRGGIEIE